MVVIISPSACLCEVLAELLDRGYSKQVESQGLREKDKVRQKDVVAIYSVVNATNWMGFPVKRGKKP